MGLGIQGTAHPQTALIEDVGVNHGGFDILVIEEFLDGTDVVGISIPSNIHVLSTTRIDSVISLKIYGRNWRIALSAG